MRASTRNLPAPALPSWARNGQSSRSPAITACTSRRVPPCSAAFTQSAVDFRLAWRTQIWRANSTGASLMATATSSRGRLPSPGKPIPPRALMRTCSPTMARPGVRTFQASPSRHASRSPSSVNARGAPRPLDQSSVADELGSNRSLSASASPCTVASRPRIPGVRPTAANCTSRRRAPTCTAPPRVPDTRRSSTVAPALAASNQVRTLGDSASLSAAKPSNGVASMRSARTP